MAWYPPLTDLEAVSVLSMIMMIEIVESRWVCEPAERGVDVRMYDVDVIDP
jgi:hypothetical protein